MRAYPVRRNTLLLSGTTVTWAHHALLHNDRKGLIQGLVLTVLLGALFSCAFVNAGLALTILGAHRLKPPMLMALRILLLVYAFPHMLLVSVLAHMSLPGAWIP